MEKETNLPSNIKLLAQELMELYTLAYQSLKPDVERIIKEKITNEYIIEEYLGRLLNIPTDKCYDLFIKLCNYYTKINPVSSNEYLKLYDELYGEDEPKAKKKDYK